MYKNLGSTNAVTDTSWQLRQPKHAMQDMRDLLTRRDAVQYTRSLMVQWHSHVGLHRHLLHLVTLSILLHPSHANTGALKANGAAGPLVLGHTSMDQAGADAEQEASALASIGLSSFEPDLGREQTHVCTDVAAPDDLEALQQLLADRRAKPGRLARPRVAVFMVVMGSCLADYGHHTVALNLAYAERHGYDLVLHDGFSGERSHPAWQKLRVVAELMSEGSELLTSLFPSSRRPKPYEVAMYIDADAAVTAMHLELEPLLAANADGDNAGGDGGGRVAGVAPSLVGCRDSWSVVNCGALLFKRTPWLMALLGRWYDRRTQGGSSARYDADHAECSAAAAAGGGGGGGGSGGGESLAACCDNLGGSAACAARHGVDRMLRCCEHYEETRYREQTLLDLMVGADEAAMLSGGHLRILEPSRGECFQKTKAHEASAATLLLHMPGTTSPLRAAVFGHLRAQWCAGDDSLGLVERPEQTRGAGGKKKSGGKSGGKADGAPPPPPSRLLGEEGSHLVKGASRAVLLRASLTSYDASLRQLNITAREEMAVAGARAAAEGAAELAAAPASDGPLPPSTLLPAPLSLLRPRTLALLAHAHFNAGSLRQHLGELDAAADHLAASVASLRALPAGEPAAPLALPRYIETQGTIASQRGQHADAIALLAAAVDEFDDDASLKAVLGSELLRHGGEAAKRLPPPRGADGEAVDEVAWAEQLLRSARKMGMARHAGVAANLGTALVHKATRQIGPGGKVALSQMGGLEAILSEAIALMEEGAVTHPQAVGGNLVTAREMHQGIVDALQAAEASGRSVVPEPPPSTPESQPTLTPEPPTPPPEPPTPLPTPPGDSTSAAAASKKGAKGKKGAKTKKGSAVSSQKQDEMATRDEQAIKQAVAAKIAGEAVPVPRSVKEVIGDSDSDGKSVAFFYQTFRAARATLEVLRSVRRCYPDAPIYLVSDAGLDYAPMCDDKKLRCRFEWSPVATRQKGGWAAGGWEEWSRRLLAALNYAEAEYASSSLRQCDSNDDGSSGAGSGECAAAPDGPSHLILLEDDVRCNRPISAWPTTDGAGVDDRSGRLTDPFTAEALAYFARAAGGREHAHRHYGLAGGTILRAAALRDALSPPTLDVEVMRGLDARIGLYNDATIAAALLAKGYTVGPWAELAEIGAPPPPPVRVPGESGTKSKKKGKKGKGPPPHAFTHNVKDWYGKELKAADAKLARAPWDVWTDELAGSDGRRCAAVRALRVAVARSPHDALSLARLGQHCVEAEVELAACDAAHGRIGCDAGSTAPSSPLAWSKGKKKGKKGKGPPSPPADEGDGGPKEMAAEAYRCALAALPVHFMVAETPQPARAKLVADVLSNLAAAEAHLGNLDAARAALRRALTADPTNVAVKDNLKRLEKMIASAQEAPRFDVEEEVVRQ